MSNRLRFTNRSLNEVKLVLEPWCDEYCIESGSTVDVIANELSDSKIEIDIESDNRCLVVYAWSNRMRVEKDGVELEPKFD